MNIVETQIPGCFEIQPKIITDGRGSFVKTFHQELFAQHGLETHWAEEYLSVSKKGVLRGMHFQLPPHAHAKLVYCIDGEVMDVLVDLRKGSPVYGKAVTFNLSAGKNNILYIPIGVAHGFYTLSEKAIMVYKTSTVHSAESDAGILWNSFDIWTDSNPIISERDNKHISFSNFASPFTF
jgi:dTDP-4-dehydrorhamnose 3,5-epimerase